MARRRVETVERVIPRSISSEGKTTGALGGDGRVVGFDIGTGRDVTTVVMVSYPDGPGSKARIEPTTMTAEEVERHRQEWERGGKRFEDELPDVLTAAQVLRQYSPTSRLNLSTARSLVELLNVEQDGAVFLASTSGTSVDVLVQLLGRNEQQVVTVLESDESARRLITLALVRMAERNIRLRVNLIGTLEPLNLDIRPGKGLKGRYARVLYVEDVKSSQLTFEDEIKHLVGLLGPGGRLVCVPLRDVTWSLGFHELLEMAGGFYADGVPGLSSVVVLDV